MWVDPDVVVRTQVRDRVGEAQRQRLVAHARASRANRSGYGRRLREATGFGLVRTGLWLLDARRA